ncbi:DUF2189 domain-containing protein [Tsuneonella flava]|uniref:DUF2189 domain-containing protein n=1 Tax=Tsuneonella flava TaxID=2055955 RepID=A0ABX7K7L4_9SPHN|nr:DUF2189 domain-containing protein [Tsuneonella flava]QSB44241.1 DUF2189 domain-containing protein [Tsuneonella flava]
MTSVGQAQIAPVTVARDLTLRDLWAALAAGARDFLACPLFGLFFGSIYVGGGLFVGYALFAWKSPTWLIPAAAGFPLIAPFVAVGLYEVSRRREAGLPRSWGAVLGALRGRGDDQIISMGVIVFVAFSFWMIVAHSIFAIFLAESGIGSESLAIFTTQAGIAMLVVGGAIGGLMALAFYAVTVMSLPMLVDREVDFLTAIITSLAVINHNRPVMMAWALIIAVVLFVAMIPAFLGLLIALPVLGHATWHLYRRAVTD